LILFFGGWIVFLFLRSSIDENVGGLFEESCFPLGDGDRMNFELCRQLALCFLLSDRRKGDFRLELRRVIRAFLAHKWFGKKVISDSLYTLFPCPGFAAHRWYIKIMGAGKGGIKSGEYLV